MTLDNIRDLIRGTSPFKLRMVSGRVIEIPHPDFVALAQSGTSIVFTDARDRLEVIRISQIESYEVPGNPSPA